MLQIFYGHFDQVMQGHSCKAYPTQVEYGVRKPSTDQNAVCCRALTLGLLISAFEPLGDCFPRLSASTVHHSVSKVYETLTSIKLHEWKEVPRNSGYSTRSHKHCDFTYEMNRQLDEAYEAIESPVLDSHVLHMKKQWAKGNTEA